MRISRGLGVQNGILLTSSIHGLFDNFLVSVNPYDGYKIINFGDDNFGLDGRTLHQNCRNTTNSENVVDELLYWHYRQCVLANMRGFGEPTFEWDFPPGTDMMKEIREGPAPIERLEIEISSRLQTDV
ncbi:hypothetical protein N7488_009469 [Penicillium malachiteum]|nr:hypothetical protein N7488_009469 [Penicillium malachiteum]